MSEFKGYGDSTDFREIAPEHSRDNNKRGVHLSNMSRTFFATPTLDVAI